MLSATSLAALPILPGEHYAWLGDQIYDKECNSQNSCLTHWNEGEDFPSLGIGHFIWYRQGQAEAFEETFPHLLAFLQANGIELPDWLGDPMAANNPWTDRQAFYADYDKPLLSELRQLLFETRNLQAAFIVQRFEHTTQDIIDATPPSQRQIVEQRLLEIANSEAPLGLYALIDYLHFKGSGLNNSERYQQQGWGLQQVLLQMRSDANSLQDFVIAAKQVLQRRVANAPAERNEQRWLRGWHNRVESYLTPLPPPTLAR